MWLKCKNISAVYGESSLKDWKCQKWFAKIYVRYTLMNNAPQLRLIVGPNQVIIWEW